MKYLRTGLIGLSALLTIFVNVPNALGGEYKLLRVTRSVIRVNQRNHSRSRSVINNGRLDDDQIFCPIKRHSIDDYNALHYLSDYQYNAAAHVQNILNPGECAIVYIGGPIKSPHSYLTIDEKTIRWSDSSEISLLLERFEKGYSEFYGKYVFAIFEMSDQPHTRFLDQVVVGNH